MSVQLTALAAQKVQEKIAHRGHGLGIRLKVKKSGCSGYAYKVEFFDQLSQQDQIFESFGVKVAVDNHSLTLLDGTEIDFVDDTFKSGFAFRNPQESARCGCGESFSVTS